MESSFLSFDPQLLQEWKHGDLIGKWFRKYDCFDQDDLRLAINRPQYHFYEWFSAIHFYKKGYRVLVEQYIYKPHKRKIKISVKIIGEDGLSFLKRASKDLKSQPPDLFVYIGKAFFFVEVKAPKDKLRENQEKLFKKIENRFSTEVVILNLNAKQF